jgi:hypothetical protein
MISVVKAERIGQKSTLQGLAAGIFVAALTGRGGVEQVRERWKPKVGGHG